MSNLSPFRIQMTGAQILAELSRMVEYYGQQIVEHKKIAEIMRPNISLPDMESVRWLEVKVVNIKQFASYIDRNAVFDLGREDLVALGLFRTSEPQFGARGSGLSIV